MMRTLRSLSVLAMLVVGGLALWRRRERIKRAYDSVGGVSGIRESANKLTRSVGPVKDLISEVSRMK